MTTTNDATAAYQVTPAEMARVADLEKSGITKPLPNFQAPANGGMMNGKD